MTRQTKILIGMLAACWAVSLVCPVAIMGARPDNVFPGWAILMMGWMGPLAGQFGWFANPGFLLALCAIAGAFSRFGVKVPIAVGLALLGLDALAWHEMYGDAGTAPILSFGVGYYFWLAAIFGASAVLISQAVWQRLRPAAAA